jgi:hypothetical protein
MVIKGVSCAGSARLAAHLTRIDTNERVEVREIRGVAADDLKGALLEMEAVASGTRTTKPFYHASISSRAEERLTNDQRTQAIDRLEAELGLTGQPRVVVVHEKEAREHCHIVWSRIDSDRMVAISDSHNYRKHELVARALEREFGHERVQGAHIEREGVERPKRTPSHAEMLQAERTGLSPKDVKEKITELWRSTDSGQTFAAALSDAGFVLARGDRRDFVVIDPNGGTHSLSRRVDGAKAQDIRERMADLDPARLPTIAEAKDLQYARAHGLTPERDQREWEDKLLAAGLAKEKQDEQKKLRISEAFVARDLAWHEKQAARPTTKTEQRLMDAYEASRNDQTFADKLARAGLSLAVATVNDVGQLAVERAVAFGAAQPGEQTRLPPQLQPGELVAINRYGEIRRLNPHKLDLDAIENRFAQSTGAKPGSVIEARDTAIANRPPEWEPRDSARPRPDDGREAGGLAAHDASRATEGATKAIADVASGIASVFESLFGGEEHKPQTPEEQAAHARAQQEAIANRADAAAEAEQTRKQAQSDPQKHRQQLLREVGRESDDDLRHDYDRQRERTRRGE